MSETIKNFDLYVPVPISVHVSIGHVVDVEAGSKVAVVWSGSPDEAEFSSERFLERGVIRINCIIDRQLDDELRAVKLANYDKFRGSIVSGAMPDVLRRLADLLEGKG